MRAPLAASVLLAALLAPAAVAQFGVVTASVAASVEDPGRALVPGANESVGILVNYRVGSGAQPTPAPTPDRPENTTPTRITLAIKEQPSWVLGATFDPSVIEIPLGIDRSPGGATGGNYPARANVILQVAPDAPALQREDIVVTAVAEPNGNIAGATGESAPVKLRATVVGKLNVTPPGASTVIAGGRWTSVPFEVRNEGNSEIVAKINVSTRPENSQVEFLDTLTLAPGATQTVDVRIRTPWTNAELGTLELVAIPIVDGDEGEPARGETELLGTSAVPGAPAAFLLGALGALALARRRRA